MLLLVLGEKISINYIMVWLIFAGFISIMLNEIPTFFRPYERYVAFTLVLSLIGPFVINTTLQLYRQKLFSIINVLLLVMVVISFLGIVARLPQMIGRSGFIGLFGHSMLLGPMAAIAMLVAINLAYTTHTKVRWLFLYMSVLAFITCVAAGSRSALMAGLAGALFYYYKTNQGKLSRFIRIIIVIVAIGIFSFPLWQPYTERIMSKMAYGEKKSDILVSRTDMWQLRINEFKSSPLVGIGFATTHAKKVDKVGGRIEPGSSWLSVLSMIGLFGFVPLVLLVLRYLKFVFKDKVNVSNSAFLGSLLLLFIVHMTAEGYILSAGSGLFFYFWLVMGLLEINIEKSLEQNKIV